MLACKNGLSPFARSAFADVPTGTPRSPLFGAARFTQRMPRLRLQTPMPLTRNASDEAVFPAGSGYDNAKRLSYHNDFSSFVGDPAANPFRNPITNRGPMEGRPPGDFFAHQRWEEFFPKVGYVMSWGQCAPGTRFHPNFPNQNPNSVWCYGPGRFTQGSMPPFLIKGRYGEPILTRIYNNTPVDRAENGGFGRNETQLHFHNAHNGAESDGATGAHHFPGTFYDYRWSTTLARRDKINTNGTNAKAAGPDNGTGIVKVPGDFREIQGTMWAHDHRFFFTAENVYKGNLGMVNYYSGRDRGHETITSGTNLRLPSGTQLGWGNTDFDVNLVLSDGATDQQGQYFFDIFTTDGFLGDLPLVNFAYAPVLRGAAEEVPLPPSECVHVAVPPAGAELERGAGSLQVHRQRRQLRRQPDPADRARRAGHRRALRHRRRLLHVPGRLPDLPGERVGDAQQRARTEGETVAGPGAGRQYGRSGGRQDDGVPGRELGAERRCAGRDAKPEQQLRSQRQEPGAAGAHRPDTDRSAGADQGGGVRPVRPRRLAGSPPRASARPTVRRPQLSPGPSR